MSYAFPNDADVARARLAALAATFDPGTIHTLEAIGVAAGWHCLEIGAGCGSIARWLAERVGPSGLVIATDLDPRHVDTGGRAQLEVRRHDLTRDPLPSAAFDLVHARLVISHLPDADDALACLRAALRPGGTLFVEDHEMPDGAIADGGSATLSAMRTLVRASVDPALGGTLAQRCRQLGFIDVEAEARMTLFRPGTPGIEVLRHSFVQLRDRMLAAGLSRDTYESDLTALDDAQFEARSPLLWSVRARRPCEPI